MTDRRSFLKSAAVGGVLMATGERKERIFTGAPYLASATVANDRLYTADHTGRVRCFVDQ